LARFGLILAAVIFFCGSGDVRAQSVNSVKCNIDFKNCLETIRSVCGGKYHIHSRGTHMGGLLADILPGPIVWFTAAYSCGEISQSSPAPPKKAIPDNGPRGYGTGFYVSGAGHILTNAHVVRSCSAIHVVGDRIAKTPAVLKGVDTTNDLAILELPKPPSLARPILPWRADVPLGGPVAVFGFSVLWHFHRDRYIYPRRCNGSGRDRRKQCAPPNIGARPAGEQWWPREQRAGAGGRCRGGAPTRPQRCSKHRRSSAERQLRDQVGSSDCIPAGARRIRANRRSGCP
jgi:hypothetical protein